MLTETRLHEKRETKRLHRLNVLKTRQARLARLERHIYKRPVTYTTLMPSIGKEQASKFMSVIKSLLRWNK